MYSRRAETLTAASWASIADPEPTFAEFFAGIGLVRMGLEAEGWRVAFANDIDTDKQAMYQTHFQDAEAHFHLGDIHDLSAGDVPTTDLATASFPCNDLSLAGSRQGLQGKQSGAFWGFIRILREMGDRRPPLVLLENVAGFLTSHGGDDIRAALSALNEIGYAVDVLVLDAVAFVPQSRVRLFIVGSLEIFPNKDHGSLVEETASFFESPLRPKALAQMIFDAPHINWKLRPLPNPPKRTLALADILENLPETDAAWWNDERTEYLMNQMSSRHRATLEQMMDGSTWSYGTVFRRVRKGASMAELRTDGVAGCLRTPRGGSGRQILVRAGMGSARARLLTPRECARLMGADDFRIETTLNKALFGFGDAVCVPAITWLAKNYLNPLLEEVRVRQQSVALSELTPSA